MNKRLSILVLFITLIMSSCDHKGDYSYIIYMKNGDLIKASKVSSEGGGLCVWPPFGEGEYYHLSSNEYSKAIFVGNKNKNNE